MDSSPSGVRFHEDVELNTEVEVVPLSSSLLMELFLGSVAFEMTIVAGLWGQLLRDLREVLSRAWDY